MSAADPNGAPAAEIVRQAARDGEVDHYFAALMAPNVIRDDVMTMAAFAAVIGHVPRAVHEPIMGEVRLQWWRDALLLGVHGEPTGHPIADAVCAVRARHRLPDELLDGVIDAVSSALSHRASPEAATDWTRILARFEGGLFLLTAHVHAGASVAGCEELFERAGVAYGLARALCGLPPAMASGWPPQLIAADSPIGDNPARMAAIAEIRQLHDTAREALAEVRRRQGKIPASAIAALLPLAMVEPYLGAQSKAMMTVPMSPVEIMPLARIWRIWRAHRRRWL